MCKRSGTRVNWCASFRTPDHVRREWARLGLPAFLSDRYAASLDAVCKRLSVSTGALNISSMVLSHKDTSRVCASACQPASRTARQSGQSSAGVVHDEQNARLKQGLEALTGVHCGEIPRSVPAAILRYCETVSVSLYRVGSPIPSCFGWCRAGTVMTEFAAATAVLAVLQAQRRLTSADCRNSICL